MFRFSADRLPVFIILMFSVLDFTVFFMVDNLLWIAIFALLMLFPKGMICAWNHHHQHKLTFYSKPLNHILEFFYALHTGATTNLWVLHHVLGHHRHFLDQSKDESGWKRKDGKTMSAFEYTFTIAGTSFYRGFKVGKKFPRVQREFILYSTLTFVLVGLLCWYRLMPGLLLFVFPMIFGLLFTSWVTYDHHAGLDTDDPFKGSFNNTHWLFNMLTGNLGYHTAHHHDGGLHWSLLPQLHEKIKAKIPSELIRNAMFVIKES